MCYFQFLNSRIMTDYQIAFVILLTVVISLDIRLLYMGRSFLDTNSSMLALKNISVHYLGFSCLKRFVYFRLL